MKKTLFIILFILLFGTIVRPAENNIKANKIPEIQFKGQTFLELDFAPDFRVYLTKKEYQRYQKEGAEEFTKQINNAINLLSEAKIPYPKEGYFQFVILPQGEVFKNISGVPWTYGINGIDGWPQALAFDDSRFFNLDPNTYFIGILHEMAHLVHGNWIEIYPICEGFAEILPFYFLNLSDEKQQKIALDLTPKEIYSVNTLIKRGMFLPEEDYKTLGRVQYLKTYISMYLWMRGYLEIVQQQYNLSKIDSLNFVLKEFKKAADAPNLKKQKKYIAKLIGLNYKKVFNNIDLQLIGQKSLRDSLSEN